jgi:hypothetical protein
MKHKREDELSQPTKRRKRFSDEEIARWEKAFFDIFDAMKQVERARAALNKGQARLDAKVAKATKEVADDFRQFLLAGGTTSDQWFEWGSKKKSKQVVPQKRGLRLVVNRQPIQRYRLIEKGDGPQAA